MYLTKLTLFGVVAHSCIVSWKPTSILEGARMKAVRETLVDVRSENVCTKALKALAGSLQIRMWHLFHAWPARSARWAQDFFLCMLAQIRTSGWPQRVHAVR